jgi:glutamate-1-semialdehyde 2,1-aminomutase
MEHLAPSGPVYQAGTLSGNPMAMAAGLATLKIINETGDFYQDLEAKSHMLEEGIKHNIRKLNFPCIINRVGSMFTLFFSPKVEINSYADVLTCDTEIFARYFNLSLENGIYLAPSQYEAGFVSSAHTQDDIRYTIEKNYLALSKLKN